VVSADGVLVLGGTGLIGSSVAATYAERGVVTRALSRNAPSADVAELHSDVEFVRGDVTDRELLRDALRGVRHVVYAVGQMLPAESTHDLIGDAQTALPAIITVLEMLREWPETSITYLSSGGTVYGRPIRLPITEDSPCDPISGYGITKLAAEKYVGMYRELYGIKTRILRISNVYGPRQQPGRSQGVIASWLAVAREGRKGLLFGDSIRDYVFIDDVVDAIVGLEPRDGEPAVVNVGSGVGNSLSDVVGFIEAASGLPLDVERVPPRPFDIHEIVLDVSRLRSLIDWNPRPLGAGILETWELLVHEIERGRS
jgi:UDP-glucose 4-epimerase